MGGAQIYTQPKDPYTYNKIIIKFSVKPKKAEEREMGFAVGRRQEVRRCRGRFVAWCNGVSEYRERTGTASRGRQTTADQVMD